MNKKEFKAALDEAFKLVGARRDTSLLYNKLSYLADQMEEAQEKVVIPQYVADYLEEAKREYPNWALNGYIRSFIHDANSVHAPDRVMKYYQESSENQKKIMKVLLGESYKVEEQELFYVLDNHDEAILYRNLDVLDENSDIAFPCNGEPIARIKNLNKEVQYQFTKEEIEEYDTRYLPFLKPIEEV